MVPRSDSCAFIGERFLQIKSGSSARSRTVASLACGAVQLSAFCACRAGRRQGNSDVSIRACFADIWGR